MAGVVGAAVRMAATVVLCGALVACGADRDEGGAGTMRRDVARRRHDAAITARPVPPTLPPPGAGQVSPDAGTGGAVLHVPGGASGKAPVGLLVMFHGAGGTGDAALGVVRAAADEHGFLVLAPDSVAATWDVIAGGWGPDVAAVDRALAWVFDRFPVDPARVVAAGFSDGASYALSLGLANGALFTDVVAYSPGFAAPPQREGMPRVFVSHGVDDRVLPIDRTSRRLVPPLEGAGYDVRYVEFAGGHEIPPDVLAAGLEVLTG